MSDNQFTSEEAYLLQRLRDGDSGAFRCVYDRYKHVMGRNLLRLLKSEVLAEELLQDLFLKIWEQRALIDPARSFKAYLYRIAENMVYDVFRRASREKAIMQEILAANGELYTHVEEALLRKENSALLDGLLAQLPSQRKKIFIACKLEGKSYREVAEELGISITTVNDHIQKAMQYLKANAHRTPSVYLMILFVRMLAKE